MKFVFASDSFKGTLSSAQIAALLEAAALERFGQAECVALSMADGGEGTLDAIAAAITDGAKPPLSAVTAHDGLLRCVQSNIILHDGNAFVEAAQSCGLTLLEPHERNPLMTTGYGVGECIRYALERGSAHVTVGLGGVCTNDGGMGCLRALGVKFYDAGGNELAGSGADLERVAWIDESGMFAQLREVQFTVMSDVTNPLCGENGATYVFGPQKGAKKAQLERLECGMENFAKVVSRTHPNVSFDTPGFGAAGGLGMALSVFCGARIASGVETLLEWMNFDKLISDADLVVTGEGRLDSQSLQGKVVSGIAAHANKEGVPVAVICGHMQGELLDFEELGLAYLIETGAGQPLEYAMQHAEENYRRAAHELFAAFKPTNR